MNDYDSDESVSDAESSISTNVLLGYASTQPVQHGDPFNQLGGSPTWLDSAQHCPPSLVQCKTCNGYTSLLLQLNGDLPSRNGTTQFLGHERRLYIWACRRKACRRKTGSVRAVRAVRVSKVLEEQDKKQVEKEQPKRDIGVSLFGGSAGGNPFASSSSSNPFASPSASSNPFASPSNPFAAPATKPESNTKSDEIAADLPATFAQKARISSPSPSTATTPEPPTAPWPSPYPIPAYSTYHLDADTEYLSPTALPAPPANNIAFLDTVEDDSNAAPSSAKEEAGLYESTHDKTFQHFADTLAQNPDQVLRYEFAGQPMLSSRSDAIGVLFHAPHAANGKVTTSGSVAKGIPNCGNCGAARVYEMQLTPQTIEELEKDEDVGLDGMDWQTIVVGVCEKDCGIKAEEVGTGKVRYLEEWCGVQWEELVARGGIDATGR